MSFDAGRNEYTTEKFIYNIAKEAAQQKYIECSR